MRGRGNVMDMSIENMANISYVMFGMSGIFAVVSVVLFFALDITRCWRMVSGRGSVHRRTTPAGRNTTEKIGKSENFAQDEENIWKSFRTGEDYGSAQETVLLGDECEDETVVLDTVSLEMIQDIVYIQDTAEIG